MTKRIATGAVTTILLVLGATGTAAADPGNGELHGQGPGPACLGPPGQSGLVTFAKELEGVPPGQIVSLCNGNGHGQNQGGGDGTTL